MTDPDADYFADGGRCLAVDLVRKHRNLQAAHAEASLAAFNQDLPAITRRLFLTAVQMIEDRATAIELVNAAHNVRPKG